AKNPAERYASADAAAAALNGIGAASGSRPIPRRQLANSAAIVLAAVALTGFAAWRITRPRALSPPSAEAAKWFDVGTEHLRDGAYYSAERAFKEAVKLDAPYAQAWAGLAEAEAELDDERAALASLLRVSDLMKTGALPRADET